MQWTIIGSWSASSGEHTELHGTVDREEKLQVDHGEHREDCADEGGCEAGTVQRPRSETSVPEQDAKVGHVLEVHGCSVHSESGCNGSSGSTDRAGHIGKYGETRSWRESRAEMSMQRGNVQRVQEGGRTHPATRNGVVEAEDEGEQSSHARVLEHEVKMRTKLGQRSCKIAEDLGCNGGTSSSEDWHCQQASESRGRRVGKRIATITKCGMEHLDAKKTAGRTSSRIGTLCR